MYVVVIPQRNRAQKDATRTIPRVRLIRLGNDMASGRVPCRPISKENRIGGNGAAFSQNEQAKDARKSRVHLHDLLFLRHLPHASGAPTADSGVSVVCCRPFATSVPPV